MGQGKVTEYSLLSGAAYLYSVSDLNQIPSASGWVSFSGSYNQEPLSYYKSNTTGFGFSNGFEARAYQKGDVGNGGEIVISYTGTDEVVLDTISGNLPLFTGLPFSPQLNEAALFYQKVKASAPEGAKITFTGHSGLPGVY